MSELESITAPPHYDAVRATACEDRRTYALVTLGPVPYQLADREAYVCLSIDDHEMGEAWAELTPDEARLLARMLDDHATMIGG